MCSHWSVPHDFTTRRALQPGAPDECVTNITRRSALALLAGVLATAADGAGVRADALPTEVAGVTIPNTALTRSAARLARSACPDFLFNHCLRTYLLGALSLEAQRLDFDAELAFTAAALHDLGLLPAFATPHGSFEIDGANRAEALLREAGRPARQGRLVWNAIVTHDIRAEYAAHQSHEAQLVAAGAGAGSDQLCLVRLMSRIFGTYVVRDDGIPDQATLPRGAPSLTQQRLGTICAVDLERAMRCRECRQESEVM